MINHDKFHPTSMKHPNCMVPIVWCHICGFISDFFWGEGMVIPQERALQLHETLKADFKGAGCMLFASREFWWWFWLSHFDVNEWFQKADFEWFWMIKWCELRVVFDPRHRTQLSYCRALTLRPRSVLPDVPWGGLRRWSGRTGITG